MVVSPLVLWFRMHWGRGAVGVVVTYGVRTKGTRERSVICNRYPRGR